MAKQQRRDNILYPPQGTFGQTTKPEKRQQISFSLCSKPSLSPWELYVGVPVKTHAKMLLASAREATTQPTLLPHTAKVYSRWGWCCVNPRFKIRTTRVSRTGAYLSMEKCGCYPSIFSRSPHHSLLPKWKDFCLEIWPCSQSRKTIFWILPYQNIQLQYLLARKRKTQTKKNAGIIRSKRQSPPNWTGSTRTFKILVIF